MVAASVAGVLVLSLVGSTAARSTSAPVGGYLFQTRGIFTEFEDPSSPNGWYSGELLHNGNFGPAQTQVASQLDEMRRMGVNEFVYELRSSDLTLKPTVPPECNISPDVGLRWPLATDEELTNLARLFDLAATKGMRIALILNNTHMEDRANSERWLGAILPVVKAKPALDYVAFGGDKRLIDLNGDGVPESCGGQAEAPLYLGPASIQGQYVQWAIGYGIALGIPPRKLTAESIVGFYPAEAEAEAGPEAQDNHLWSPVAVMRTIFDRLGVPAEQRTYSISFYAHRKCAGFPFPFPCTEEPPQSWAERTAEYVRDVTGSVARVTATEFGALTPVESSWPTAISVEGLGVVMQRFGIDGGTFWRWHDVTGDAPSSFPDPVKKRGRNAYYAVQRELADLYGFHLSTIPNGSFENGTTGWIRKGIGTSRTVPLDEPAPWRGGNFLRIRAKSSMSVTSGPIRVRPSVTYTTTASLRFNWTGDRHTRAATPKRPHVLIALTYLTCQRKPSKVRPRIIHRYVQHQRTTGFATFPVRHTTPRDACYVRLQFGAKRNGLPAPITLDVDAIR
jgi:hypothetical protein